MDAMSEHRDDGVGERVTRNAQRVTRPTLSVRNLPDALSIDALKGLSAPDLIAFLRQRRWFGAKAGAPRSASIRDVVRLPWEGGDFALARVEVVPASGGPAALYQLPLCVRALEEIGEDLPSSVVASVIASEEENEGLLFDAVEDGAFLRALTHAMTKGASVTDGSVGWRATSTSATPLVIPVDASIRLGSAEQSNTSVIVDRLAIVKLLRTLQPGEHPDVEMTRYLTVDAEFPHTPVLLGVAELVEADVVTVAGMMQEYLPESVDAWHFALDVARPYFAAPAGREPANAFLDHAEHLGRVTRELHEALARGTTPAFAPERATRERLAEWANGAREWIAKGLALLEQQLRAKALPKERMGEAEALVNRRAHFVDSAAQIVNEVANDAGAAIRIHGDYHLGQVLRTARDDFMIIDFEGEPLRSLEERRQKASPLRDVAGMLRSFAYAAATLGMEAKGADTPTRELRIGRWERDSREAFLRGYLHEERGAATDAPQILPSEGSHVRALLRLFETEKAFYELVYELNNRPNWVWIPMRGIAKLL